MQFEALKPFRRKRAGEIFDASPRHKRVLEATGLAREYVAPPPPPSPAVEELRAKAEEAGVQVDKRWGKSRLERELEAVAQEADDEPKAPTYQRRDMRAED